MSDFREILSKLAKKYQCSESAVLRHLLSCPVDDDFKKGLQEKYVLLITAGLIKGDPNESWETNEEFRAIKIRDLPDLETAATTQEKLVFLSKYKKERGL